MTTTAPERELVERDWRLPYRTMDASGSPTAADVVGWNWIGDLAQQERERDAALLVIQGTPVEGGGKVTRLYRSTTLLATATTFRDDMNFTVLVRWKADDAATIQSLLADKAKLAHELEWAAGAFDLIVQRQGVQGDVANFAMSSAARLRAILNRSTDHAG